MGRRQQCARDRARSGRRLRAQRRHQHPSAPAGNRSDHDRRRRTGPRPWRPSLHVLPDRTRPRVRAAEKEPIMATTEQTRVRDVLAISDLSHTELQELLHMPRRMKARPADWTHALVGETVVCFFQKPSTRTRVSLHAAIARLGAAPLLIRPDELQLGRGEPISDTARVLSGYACAIAARVFSQQTIEEMAANSAVPVINALSDLHHPCQALADLMTVEETFGSLTGLRLAYVGEGNNVAHSLMEAGALLGMEIVVASPDGLGPDPEVTAAAAETAAANGGSVSIVSHPLSAATNASVIY